MSIVSFDMSDAFDGESKPRNKRRFNKKSRDKKSDRGGDTFQSRTRRPDFDDEEFPESFVDFDDEEFDKDEDLDDLDDIDGLDDDDDDDDDDDFDFEDDDDR